MQIILFLLLILAILLIFVSKKESLTNSIKVYIISSFVLIFFAGWLYTFYNQKIAHNEREIINAFEQGKTITCGDYKINSNSFIFVSGTLSFVARENIKDLKGVVVDISTCKK